jgi:preprotein translocase subunit YajC
MSYTLLAQDPAPAPGPANPQQPGGLFGSPMFPFFLIGLMLLFWVVVILPMSRRQKREQEQQLATLKRGAKILTNAGIVATVVTANDGEDEIVIRSEDTKLRIKRNVVVQVLDAGTAAPEPAKQS